MQLQVFRHAWGAVGESGAFPTLSALLRAAKTTGYDGIELPLLYFHLYPEVSGTPEQFRAELDELDLVLLPMVLSFGRTPEEHLRSFRKGCEAVAQIGGSRVVAHAGADHFSDLQALRFLDDCLRVSADLGIEVAFETHRGRVLSTPWRSAMAVERLPELWLNADFSHFVCVCERLLEDQVEVMELLASRSRHAHIRVGHENGPQVPDPRLEQWSRHVAAHERWWDAVWRAAEARGDATVSLTPEYGPPTYAPPEQDPETLRDICDWAARRARDRFRSGAWRETALAGV